jgi:hypothetical protein
MIRTRTTNLRAAAILLALGTSAMAQADPAVGFEARVEPLEQLDAVIKELDDLGGQGPVTFRRLEAMLAARPALAAEIPVILRAGAVGDTTQATLVRSLEVTGSAHAQSALRTIYRDPGQKHMNRLRGIIGAAGLVEPRPESIEGLWSVALQRSHPADVDLSNTAQLALGALGSTLRRSGKTTRYGQVRAGLVTSLHTTANPLERSVLLKAVGNTLDPELHADVLPYLHDEHAPVRASAAQSLGMLREDATLGLLIDRLHTEERGVVRAALVRAIARLSPTEGAVLEIHALMPVERHPTARGAMVTYLGQHQGMVPAIRGTLEHALGDDSQLVRDLAAEALGG